MGYYRLNTLRRYYEREGKYRFILQKSNILKKLQSFKEYNWVWCDSDLNKNNLIPTTSGVYAIVITDIKKDKSDFAYIGCTGNLNRRLYHHTTLRFLLAKLCPTCRIDIYVCETDKYKSFENEVTNICKPFLNTKINKRVAIKF